MIYFDNAATTIYKPQAVKQAVIEAMESFGNSGRSAHGESLEASRAVYRCRQALAKLFGCPRADRVIFTCNSTEALNIAICGLINPGDHVISTDLEHNSVLRPLYHLEELGAELDFVRADAESNIDYSDFESLICPETKLIITTHASNLTGKILDIKRIGEIAHKNGLLYIVDASQTAGAIDINMQDMNIDVLCFTGHKALMGPQGTGGLAIMDNVEIRPFKRGGTGVQSHLKAQPDQYPERLEAGTLNGHGIAGLLAGVEFILDTTPKEIHKKELQLARRFADGIRNILGLHIYADSNEDKAPIVLINFENTSSSELADALWEDYEIATRAGAHCAPRLHEALGTTKQGAVRFSFGYYNTEEEVDKAIAALKELASE